MPHVDPLAAEDLIRRPERYRCRRAEVCPFGGRSHASWAAEIRQCEPLAARNRVDLPVWRAPNRRWTNGRLSFFRNTGSYHRSYMMICLRIGEGYEVKLPIVVSDRRRIARHGGSAFQVGGKVRPAEP